MPPLMTSCKQAAAGIVIKSAGKTSYRCVAEPGLDWWQRSCGLLKEPQQLSHGGSRDSSICRMMDGLGAAELLTFHFTHL